MSVSSADTRKLSFPLQNPEVLVGDTPNDGTPILPFSWPTTDNDEKIQITLELSLNEYVALASAVDVGRDIAYGDDTNLIWWIWTRSLIDGGIMTCDDVADCIETNENVMTVLLERLAANGITQNNIFGIPATVLTPAQTAENLIPPTVNCTNQQLFAMCRNIIVELNEAIRDLFDQVELMTNPSELAGDAGAHVEGVSYLALLPKMLDKLQEWIVEGYNAAYTDNTEDLLACAIFCIAIEDCEISLDNIITALKQSMTGFELPPDDAPYDVLINWFLDLLEQTGAAAVATVMYIAVQTMKFAQGLFSGMTVLTDLKEAIQGAIGYADYTYDECDCTEPETPNNYWYMAFDFALGQQITYQPSGAAGVWGSYGYEGRGTPTVVNFQHTLGTTAVAIAQVQMTSQRRGSESNGTTDYSRAYWNANADGSGTWNQFFNHNFETENTNNVVRRSPVFTPPNVAHKAIRWQASVTGAYVAGTNICKVLKVEVWGHNIGNYKPPNSIWVASLPT